MTALEAAALAIQALREIAAKAHEFDQHSDPMDARFTLIEGMALSAIAKCTAPAVKVGA